MIDAFYGTFPFWILPVVVHLNLFSPEIGSDVIFVSKKGAKTFLGGEYFLLKHLKIKISLKKIHF